MKIKNIAALLLLFVTIIVSADPYEIILTTEPADAVAKLYIVHPFNNSTSDYYGIDHRYNDCSVNNPSPDWGVKRWENDNPTLDSNSKKFTADIINDPGDCIVRVEINGSGSANCTVVISNWPGMEYATYKKTLDGGDSSSNSWEVVSLPCAKDIKMTILKAKQNRTSFNLKIKATFEQIELLSETSTYFRASLDSSKKYNRMEPWMYFTRENQMKIKKGGTIGKFGNPVKAIVKATTKNKIIAKGRGMYMYQNTPLRVLIAFGGQSGFQYIDMDKKAKYKVVID